MAREASEYEQELERLIRPLRAASWEADYEWGHIETSLPRIANDYGGLDLIPDFQRGHVWTEAQQSRFVEACIRGVVPSSGYLIQFNCANWKLDGTPTDLPDGFQCVDGLQRYTAITRFMRDEIRAFGLLASDLMGTQFSPKRMRVRMAVLDFTERADLLDHYLAINSGGTPHSLEEIERVRALRDALKG